MDFYRLVNRLKKSTATTTTTKRTTTSHPNSPTTSDDEQEEEEDTSDLLLVQTCVVDPQLVVASVFGTEIFFSSSDTNTLNNSTQIQECVRKVWKSATEHDQAFNRNLSIGSHSSNEGSPTPTSTVMKKRLIWTDKVRIRHILQEERRKEEREGKKDDSNRGGNNHGTQVKVSSRDGTSKSPMRTTRKVPTAIPTESKRGMKPNFHQDDDNGDNIHLQDEVNRLRRKYKILLKLVLAANNCEGDEFLCGCCQINTFSSNPASLDRAPLSSRSCGHTICRSCVSNCHVAQLERLEDMSGAGDWIKCPLCNTTRAFRVSEPLVNRNLCTAINATHIRHQKALQQLSKISMPK